MPFFEVFIIPLIIHSNPPLSLTHHRLPLRPLQLARTPSLNVYSISAGVVAHPVYRSVSWFGIVL